jgi:hypothetical protein
LKHTASARFWRCFERLPAEVQSHWFWIGTHAEYDKLVG